MMDKDRKEISTHLNVQFVNGLKLLSFPNQNVAIVIFH
jgi:hypothetical protein